MNIEKYNVIKDNKGFIAALDQSGGSSKKTLKLYGIDEDSYNEDSEMFKLINDMRTRIITSDNFTNEHIIGTILFEKTMDNKIGDVFIPDYLWKEKKITAFLKIDSGLAELENGVQMMKPILDLDEKLERALKRNVFGTKMRSVIKEANEEGIEKLVKQQFDIAKKILDKGLVPIIEPEVDINSFDKAECERILKKEIDKNLKKLDQNERIMFKFTLPEVPNFYLEYTNHVNVVRVVALSGGYDRNIANQKLSKNENMIASFSRALLADLNVNQTKEEFDQTLNDSIISIYNASIEKAN